MKVLEQYFFFPLLSDLMAKTKVLSVKLIQILPQSDAVYAVTVCGCKSKEGEFQQLIFPFFYSCYGYQLSTERCHVFAFIFFFLSVVIIRSSASIDLFIITVYCVCALLLDVADAGHELGTLQYCE